MKELLSRVLVSAALLVLSATGAFAQTKEIRIAHVYDKTGPLEAMSRTQLQVEPVAEMIMRPFSAEKEQVEVTCPGFSDQS